MAVWLWLLKLAWKNTVLKVYSCDWCVRACVWVMEWLPDFSQLIMQEIYNKTPCFVCFNFLSSTNYSRWQILAVSRCNCPWQPYVSKEFSCWLRNCVRSPAIATEMHIGKWKAGGWRNHQSEYGSECWCLAKLANAMCFTMSGTTDYWPNGRWPLIFELQKQR